jgi:Zn-dependent protease with chaperone function
MLASRILRPAFRAATRSFTTATKPRTPFTIRQTTSNTFTFSTPNSKTAWQTTFRRAQTRQYRRQAFNYQRFEQSSNILRRWAARPTFYYEVGGLGALCGGYYISNLEIVPVSGRRRFNVVSADTEKKLGDQMFQETLQEFGKQILPPDSKEHQMVQRVLDRLIPHSGLAGEEWEVHVIDDDMKNAFVIPGGKVFVFRGILDICNGDDGLAAVLGHEIAHNVCHHAAERMSQAVVLLPIGLIAWVAAGIDPSIVRFGTSLAFTLPGSRRQEEEADHVGLLMMAESCYDPSAAMGLWSRMEKEEKGAPPQFLSTHPSSHNRLEKIRTWLPEAEVKRESSDCAVTAHYGTYHTGSTPLKSTLIMEQLAISSMPPTSNAGD